MTTHTDDGLPLPAHLESLYEGGVEIDYLSNEVLTTVDDVGRASAALDERGLAPGDPVELADLAVVKIPVHPPAGTTLAEEVGTIIDTVEPTITLRLNHLLHPMVHIHVWPGSLPVPANTRPVADGTRGARQRVAVLDTGLDALDWFGGTCDPSSNPEIVPEILLDDEQYVLSPIYGHGTFAAGIVHQQAPAATILGRQLALDCSMAPADVVARQIVALAAWNPTVVNLSWGAYTHRNLGTLAVERAVDVLLRRCNGVAVVAAVGNDGVDVPTYPAAYKPVVAVGACDDGHRAVVRSTGFPEPFEHWASNFGAWVDVYRDGVDVLSVFPRPPARLRLYQGGDAGEFDHRCALWSGTSFAAPMFAGEVAALAAESGRTAAEAAQELVVLERRPSLVVV